MLDWLQKIIVSNGIVIIGAAIFDVHKSQRIFHLKNLYLYRYV